MGEGLPLLAWYLGKVPREGGKPFLLLGGATSERRRRRRRTELRTGKRTGRSRRRGTGRSRRRVRRPMGRETEGVETVCLED